MKYLDFSGISALINAGKNIQQILGKVSIDGFEVFSYLTIFKNKDNDFGIYHSLVFDDRYTGIEDINHFSAFDADEPEGKYYEFNTFDEAMQFAMDKVGAKKDKFIMFGYLQDDFLHRKL